jgi:hypothetical protein
MIAHTNRLGRLLLATSISILALAWHSARADSYTFNTIDPAGPGVDSSARGINNYGTVVGYYNQPGGNLSYIYTGGALIPFAFPGAGAGTDAAGINDSGQIVGFYNPGAGARGPTAFIDNGGLSPFSSGIEPYTILSDINDAGTAVGYTYGATASSTQGIVESGGGVKILNNPAATQGTYPQAINDSGTIAGYYQDGSGSHSFTYTGGVFAPLADPSASGNSTFAEGINDAGTVAGWFTDGSGTHGFIDNGGSFTTINDPNGPGSTYVYGINDAGAIEGQYESGGVFHGFVATPTPSQSTLVFLRDFHGSPNPSHPTPLPVGKIIGSVTDTLSAPFVGDAYEFKWPGLSLFNAVVSITGLPPDAMGGYTVQLDCVVLVGNICPEQPLHWTLDSSDGFTADIEFSDFYPGLWEIVLLPSSTDLDPDLTIVFLTPVEGVAEGVPEPCALALLGVGLGGLAALRRRKHC